MAGVVVLKRKADLAEMLSQNKYIVLWFWADWCKTSAAMKPVVEELCFTYMSEPRGVIVFMTNLNDHYRLAAEYEIDCFPTAVFIKESVEVSRRSGELSEAELRTLIQNAFGQD